MGNYKTTPNTKTSIGTPNTKTSLGALNYMPHATSIDKYGTNLL